MASQDAATKLDHWYNNAYLKSSETALQVKENGLQKIKDTTIEQRAALKEEIESEMNSFLLSKLAQSNDSIKNYEKDYNLRLEMAQSNLLEGISFDTTDSENSQLESEITDEVEELLSEVLGE
jgi:predicted HicB family RNase H-like nuclease